MSAERILVIGGGGREHALCWRIRRDRPEAELFAAPGNAGIARLATPVALEATDVMGLVAWCRREGPDLVVIGPDDPLAAGLVDALGAAGVRAFGPTAAAARLESSKAWAAGLLAEAGVPTPLTHVFDAPDEADTFIDANAGPWVVKADGLARGKGVLVCDDAAGAHAAVDRIARARAFGAAGDRLVLQRRVEGPELSVFAICDGRTLRVIGAARDHKRLEDGDRGPNTGGMGAFAPVAGVDAALLAGIEATILVPTLDAMAVRGCPFVGFLYAGLMLTEAGPLVIEFNARLGDPEAQVLLPLLRFDLVGAMRAAVEGDLGRVMIPDPAGAAVCVVLASAGYPDGPVTGVEISGLDELERGVPDTIAFHAATVEEGGHWRTSGGRVVGVTGLGATLAEARQRAYDGVAGIRFEGAARRSDIAATTG